VRFARTGQLRRSAKASARASAKASALAALACTLLSTGHARAEAEVPESEAKAYARLGLIALRVLAYDKELAARAPGAEVSIVIVSGSTAAARRERARWAAGFALMPKVKAGGRAVRVHAVDFESEQALDAIAAAHRPAGMIALSDLTAELPAVRRIARARKALTITRQESAVREGSAVGLIASDDRDGKDEIVINLGAARAEGVRFDAGLLQLARLVGERGR
jgi:YfiR/HmsC-like